MTRERWEQILFAHVSDEVVQDMLNEYVLELESSNAKLRELVRDYEHCSVHADCDRCKYDGTTSAHCPLSPCFPDIDELRELGVEEDDGK